MKTVAALLLTAVLLALIGWWAVSLIMPVDIRENESVPSSTAKNVPTLPELNPVEKTNPFAGAYKNPFAN